ncbi:MAG TPA: DUF5312 family protein [Spirochaetia bacterium]|nr:DUF5312 family protein [Spirochaetia bacterium]
MMTQDLDTGKSVSGQASKFTEPTFFERLFLLFVGGDDPEREKRRLLKQIAKDLKKQKFKFFHAKADEALPGLARYFLDIYKIVGPAQSMLSSAQASAALKSIVVESFLTEEQRHSLETFDEAAVRERAKDMQPKELAGRLKESMVRFFSGFDSKTVKEITDIYTVIQSFVRFASFDYYFVLRKFDSSIPENSYSINPKFDTISAEYIVDDLKDFQDVSFSIDRDVNWDQVFDVLKSYRGIDVLSRPAWKKLVSTLDEVKRSDVLTLIIKHTSKDPFYQPSVSVATEHIVEPYLNTIKTKTEAVVQKILHERRDQKIEQLCTAVFGTSAISRTKNYTEKANIIFSKRVSGGYSHTTAINYLKAFLLDFFKKDIRELHDLLIVRGKWSTNFLSQQFSEAFHQTMTVAETIVQFDDSLADEGELGMKIRKAMGRIVDRDPSSSKLLRTQIEEVNRAAQHMINESAQNLIVIAKNLRSILEDYDKAEHELLLNWKEIEALSEAPIKGRIVEVYKKMYYFVQLMQMFVKSQ